MERFPGIQESWRKAEEHAHLAAWQELAKNDELFQKTR